jgi:nucleosome binding factor SPN SPT16 subunit
MRPNISGRKTNGVLEAHINGLKYSSTKNETIIINYENIKHAFF